MWQHLNAAVCPPVKIGLVRSCLVWNQIHLWQHALTCLTVTRDGEVLVAARRVVLQELMDAHVGGEVETRESGRSSSVERIMLTAILGTGIPIIAVAHHTHWLAVSTCTHGVAEQPTLWKAHRSVLCIPVDAPAFVIETNNALTRLISQKGSASCEKRVTRVA
ncbi:hypothetical protein C0581_01645 [Candidatus Parcubacteria bacterium]|nr:MAG: hypothetical protein C0581_01645 [Candidatus Parcubacteria bacterium]